MKVLLFIYAQFVFFSFPENATFDQEAIVKQSFVN
jgi:hypothetical protein